jgi:hypothetical protein
MKAVYKRIPLVSVLLCTACSDCGGGPGQIEKKTGDALPIESVSLGIGKDAFVKQSLALGQLRDVDVTVDNACHDQISMGVPDIDDRTIVERGRGSRALSNCTVLTNLAAQSTTLLELRGEFIDDRLARLTLRFKPEAFDKLKQDIERRFGKGAEMTLKEQMIVDEKRVDYQIWQETGEMWLLSRGETGTALLVHQDMKASETLPEPQRAARRGEPVSLDDLGIGKLDLNAPLPELDLPDAGTKPEVAPGGPAATEKQSE